MSDVINKLAEQAKASIPPGTLSVDQWIEQYNQKFADLIIFECIKIAVFKGDRETARAIREWFGVQ
jgi:hypothetical protein